MKWANTQLIPMNCEMTVAVAEAHASRTKKPLIDIGIMRGEEETIVTFRENEKPCNLLLPDPENPPDENSGIEVFKKAATSVEYTRQLGFNTIIAKFERSVS